VPLVHFSTDYVFDGSSERPWREDDPPFPLNVYGRSKLAGEEAVRAEAPAHVILRTSWVFSPYGSNFVRTMRRLGATHKELRVVADQRGGPTEAHDIASAVLAIASAIASERGVWGTFHYSGMPATTWYEFAQVVLSDRRDGAIAPIPSEDYPTPARRPRNSVLDCGKLERAYGIVQPDWRLALKEVLKRLARDESQPEP
jgi:dTDP-4-dehydrorhamnose reductase